MDKKKYIYWKDEDMWLGYLEKFPDYITPRLYNSR